MSNHVKPHIVLVHGACHHPNTWDGLVSRLNKENYFVTTPGLVSVGAQTPLESNEPDVSVIRAQLEKIINNGEDVVLVLHSYAGITGSDACPGLSKKEREAVGQSGGITHIVYLAAFMLLEGQTLVDGILGVMPTWIEFKDGFLHVSEENAYNFFYTDLDRQTSNTHAKQLRTHSPGTFDTPLKYAAWKHIPSTYVFAELDAAITPVMQEAMIKHEEFKGRVVRIRAAHCLYLSQPDEVMKIIRAAAGESQ